MARPYFTGNYGSALARVDTRPIIEAGRAQGQMYANMGAQIGGMIQQYGLNKEKQKKQKANIKSTVNFLDSLAQNDPAMEDQYASMKDQLLNEDISLTERDALASQGLKQISLSSQLETQRLNQDTARLANEFAEETRNLRADMLGQQRDFGEIRNKLQSLNLDKVEQLQPDEIKARFAELKSIIDTMPSFTASKIKQAEGVVRDEDTRGAYVDLRGGPMGVAAQQATLEDLGVEQTEANIDRTRGLTDALDAQVELMKRPPIDTTIPGNKAAEESISDITKEIDSILKSPSFVKNEDGDPQDIEDLVTINPIDGETEVSEEANKYAQADINRLKELVKRKYELRLGQKIRVKNKNGETIEVTQAEYEAAIAKHKADLLKEKQEEALRTSDTVAPSSDLLRGGGSMRFGRSRL